ncbi:MAG TPA: tRNA pseudouridine(55) synthase TruB [Firmicutes bacterium]|nr:tRNA pseudouridine(55) synthase TruB [Bacillota bacterium]
MDGFLLIDKPQGVTSRDVVDDIVKKFNMPKVGHTGSLDPFATGLLVITLGKGTKAGPYLEALEKTYVATLKLGTQTDSGDLTGKVIATSEVFPLFDYYVQETLEMFLGDTMQTPPMHSALKVAGVPLYKLAHEGISIPRESRKIHVHEIKLNELKTDEITFTATVSKGTYMRTLGEDIAKKFGMVGHLISLRRTQVGSFSVNDSSRPETIGVNQVRSVYEGLSFMPQVIITGDLIKDVKDGKPQLLKASDNTVLLVSDKQEVLAVYEKRESGLYFSVRGLF